MIIVKLFKFIVKHQRQRSKLSAINKTANLVLSLTVFLSESRNHLYRKSQILIGDFPMFWTILRTSTPIGWKRRLFGTNSANVFSACLCWCKVSSQFRHLKNHWKSGAKPLPPCLSSHIRWLNESSAPRPRCRWRWSASIRYKTGRLSARRCISA